jgi:hypothetical protein
MYYDPQCKPEVTLEPWQQVLLDAASLIEQKGWCQGSAMMDDASCAAWAITQAARNLSQYDYGLAEHVGNRLARIVGARSIPFWNDAPGRTKEEVIAAMRAAVGVGV